MIRERCRGERKRVYKPRYTTRKRFCINGHDTWVEGRVSASSGGSCKACSLEKARETRTGCTPEKYRELYQSQAGRCAVCKSEPKGRRKELQADHDHLTGSMRGLLCGPCNLALGNSYESVEILKALIEYLGGVNDAITV